MLTSAVLRLKHDLGKGENTIGMLATSYNFIEKHNQLGGIDGRFSIDKQTTFNFQVLGTTSRNFFSISRRGRSLSHRKWFRLLRPIT